MQPEWEEWHQTGGSPTWVAPASPGELVETRTAGPLPRVSDSVGPGGAQESALPADSPGDAAGPGPHLGNQDTRGCRTLLELSVRLVGSDPPALHPWRRVWLPASCLSKMGFQEVALPGHGLFFLAPWYLITS